MLFKKIITAALTFALSSTAVQAGFSSDNSEYDFKEKQDDSSQDFIDEFRSKRAEKNHLWNTQWSNKKYSWKDERNEEEDKQKNSSSYTYTKNSWGFDDKENEGWNSEEPISYKDFQDYHGGIDYWWLEWIRPQEERGQDWRKKFKRNKKLSRKLHKKFKRWKKGYDGKVDPPTQVPAPAAYILFSSALGIIVARKKFSKSS